MARKNQTPPKSFEDALAELEQIVAEIEGGEIGSGHSTMAVFEIEPTDFNRDAVERDFSPGNIAEIKLQYKLPNEKMEKQFSAPIPLSYKDFNSIDRNLRFSTSVIMFGSLLRSSFVAKNTITEYGSDTNLLKMIEEDLIAERIAISFYRKLIEWFGINDPTTRRMLELILKDEEEHADDLAELLRE